MRELQNKVAIVTGSSAGVGAATAIAFAKAGAKVVVTGRNAEGLAKSAAACRSAGAEVLVVEADLGIYDNLESLIRQTIEKFSSLDILVNNAARGSLGPVKNVGCVVNVSSVSSFVSSPNVVSYSMTKAALDHFTKGFSAECARFGVRITSINPGMIDTKIRYTMGLPKEAVPKMEEEILKKQPLGIIQPEQIADAILFLCTSSHITGSLLTVDGGLSRL